MESPVPAPIQDESTVKKEEPAISNDVQMTDAPEAETETETETAAETETEAETKPTETAPAPVGSLATVDGVTKDGYAVMDEVVHKLSDYRTEEYVN